MSRKEQQVNSDARKTMAILGQHVKELVGRTLDSAAYGSHGHAAERQGAAGRWGDADKQAGAYVPQNMYARKGSARRPAFTRRRGLRRARSTTSATARSATIE
jgi:hypothetical protein